MIFSTPKSSLRNTVSISDIERLLKDTQETLALRDREIESLRKKLTSAETNLHHANDEKMALLGKYQQSSEDLNEKSIANATLAAELKAAQDQIKSLSSKLRTTTVESEKTTAALRSEIASLKEKPERTKSSSSSPQSKSKARPTAALKKVSCCSLFYFSNK